MREPGAAVSLLRLRMGFDPASRFGRAAEMSLAPTSSTIMIALLAAISYYAGSRIGFLLTPAYTPISTFWPPNAILFAILLLTAPRIWPVILLAVLPAHLFIQLRTGVPLISALSWFVGNTGEGLLGAVWIRLFKRDKPLFESLHGVMIFLALGVLVPTFLTSFLDAGGVTLTGLGQDYWRLWTNRLTSNIASDLSIVPMVVIFGVSGIAWLRRVRLTRYFEASALVVAVVGVSLLVFGRETSGSSTRALIYLSLLPLVWAAVRFGCAGLSISMLVLVLIALWNTVHGRGPLGYQAPVDAVVSIRTLLIAFSVPLMFLAALLAERQRHEVERKAMRSSLISAQEEESQRIARELHTDIAGRLTLVGLSVDQFRTEANAGVRPALDQLYGEIQRVWNETLKLSHDVYPFTVEYLGLTNALKKLCHNASARSGIRISFSAENMPASMPSEVSRRLFRLAKAALENITQHSQAKTATVELKVSGGRVLLLIADAGVGISPQHDEGVGMASMREQVLSLEGTFRITSIPQQGTVIEASVPIKPSS